LLPAAVLPAAVLPAAVLPAAARSRSLAPRLGLGRRLVGWTRRRVRRPPRPVVVVG
jgi:hypothetical protein